MNWALVKNNPKLDLKFWIFKILALCLTVNNLLVVIATYHPFITKYFVAKITSKSGLVLKLCKIFTLGERNNESKFGCPLYEVCTQIKQQAIGSQSLKSINISDELCFRFGDAIVQLIINGFNSNQLLSWMGVISSFFILLFAIFQNVWLIIHMLFDIKSINIYKSI